MNPTSMVILMLVVGAVIQYAWPEGFVFVAYFTAAAAFANTQWLAKKVEKLLERDNK